MNRRPPAPRRPPPPVAGSRGRRWILYAALITLVFAIAAVVVGVMVVNRLETGTWEVPQPGDFVRIVEREARPPTTIFLQRRSIELRPGVDDASAGVSSVLASFKNAPAKLPGWKGTNATWAKVLACVKDQFAPFDVEVTDQRPTHTNFALVAVGGKPTDIGGKDKRVGGLAPFSGSVIERPIVFAFSAALDHQVRPICETIAMEVAHAYGLDHGYECKDVMTYLTGCGAKKFVDKDVRCGEKKARDCEGGAPTQNSYQHLLKLLGPRPAN